MSDYYGREPIHGTLIYGDDVVSASAGTVCRVCGERLAKPDSTVCKRHIMELRRAREQVQHVVEIARRRRIRRLIHAFWTEEVIT